MKVRAGREVMSDASEVHMGDVTEGKGNDRCYGSSSKNESNGKFDLNHF